MIFNALVKEEFPNHSILVIIVNNDKSLGCNKE